MVRAKVYGIEIYRTGVARAVCWCRMVVGRPRGRDCGCAVGAEVYLCPMRLPIAALGWRE